MARSGTNIPISINDACNELEVRTNLTEARPLARVVVALVRGMDGVGVCAVLGCQVIIKEGFASGKENIWEYNGLQSRNIWEHNGLELRSHSIGRKEAMVL
jgi:hypothetical protein